MIEIWRCSEFSVSVPVASLTIVRKEISLYENIDAHY